MTIPLGTGVPAALPASFLQEELFEATQGRSSHNIVLAWRILGQTSVWSLEAALNAVVDRHEALRTTLRRRGGEIVQVISPHGGVGLIHHDISRRSGAGRTRRLLLPIRQLAEHSFDLGHESLIRAGLMQLSDRDHVLALTLNHAICDNWSTRVLLDEFAECYSALSNRNAARLADVTLHFGDYAAWERGEFGVEEGKYWSRQLRAPRPPVHLVDDERARQSNDYRGLPRALSDVAPAVVRRIGEIARRQHASMAMAITAGVVGSLSRLAPAGMTVGLLDANRGRPELRCLIGCVIDVIPLRVRVSAAPSFNDLVALVRELTLQAYGHRMPIGAIRRLEAAQPDIDASYDVILNLMLPEPSLQHVFRGPFRQAAVLRVLSRPVSAREFRGRFPWIGAPLSYILRLGSDERLTGILEADAHRFSPASVSWHCVALSQFLRQAALHPSTCVHELAMAQTTAPSADARRLR